MPASCSAVTRRVTAKAQAMANAPGSSAQVLGARGAASRAEGAALKSQIATNSPTEPRHRTPSATSLPDALDVASVLQQLMGRFDQLDTSMQSINQRISALEPNQGQITSDEVAPWTTEIAAARSQKRSKPNAGNDSLAILETAITQARAADSYAKKPCESAAP